MHDVSIPFLIYFLIDRWFHKVWVTIYFLDPKSRYKLEVFFLLLIKLSPK